MTKEAVFCPNCGVRVAGHLAVPPIAPRHGPEHAEAGISGSDVVYLFSDRFVSGASPLGWFFGERKEETPCKNRSVKLRDLANLLLVTAFVYSENARLISLSLGRRTVLGGVLRRNTILARRLNEAAIDPASLEGLLAAKMTEPGEQNVFDLVRAVLGQNSSYVERFRPHGLVTRIVKRHLAQRELLREVDLGGLW